MNIADLYIETNQSYQDLPTRKHPLLVRWPFDVLYNGTTYVSGGTEAPYAEWKPDPGLTNTISYADDIINFLDNNTIADSYARLYNSSDNPNGTWSANIDADYDGIINIKDVCTVLTEIMVNGDQRTGANVGVRLSGLIDYAGAGDTFLSVRETPKVLAQVVCQDVLDKRSCVPCPCPDEIELRENEVDDITGLFISDYQIVSDPSSLESSSVAINFVDDDGNFILDRYGSTINDPKNLSLTEEAKGVITISYYSDSNIDGYWLKLGNFRDLNNIIGHSGIRSFTSSSSSECDKRQWSQYIGRDTDHTAAIPDNIFGVEESEKIRTHNKIAFGFANRVFDYIDSDSDPTTARVSGSYSLPKTPGKRSRVLTKIVVNPASFEGEPTIESFRLVTNDSPVAPFGVWTGDSSIDGDGLIGRGGS